MNVRMPARFLDCLMFFCVLAPSIDLIAQNIELTLFTPPVVRADASGNVLFEAWPSGDFTRVLLEMDGTDRPMTDDGANGDRAAGDGVYAIRLTASEIIGRLKPADVFRPFIGYCKLMRDATQLMRVNIFAEVRTGDIPGVPVEKLEAGMQVSPNLVNMTDTARTTVTPEDAARWGRRFYGRFADRYDFLNVITLNGTRGNRFHFAVQNAVGGIGMPLFDGSNQYGSAGRLQGITCFPLTTYFDGAETAYHHELGHQWINFLRDTPLKAGVPHWPLSDLASGVMGYSKPGGQGLSFPYTLQETVSGYLVGARPGEPVFNDLELYLMGLLPPDSVQIHFVFQNQDQTPMVGQVLPGPVTSFTLQDIVAAEGARTPSFKEAPKRFRIASLIISENLLSSDAMCFYNYFAKRAESKTTLPFHSGFSQGTAKPFFISTGGRGSLDTGIDYTFNRVGQAAAGPADDVGLVRNYPNPFNGTTIMSYDLNKGGRVRLMIFDAAGRCVAVPADENQSPGRHSVRWEADGMPAGLYVCRIQTDGSVKAGKMLLLK